MRKLRSIGHRSPPRRCGSFPGRGGPPRCHGADLLDARSGSRTRTVDRGGKTGGLPILLGREPRIPFPGRIAPRKHPIQSLDNGRLAGSSRHAVAADRRLDRRLGHATRVPDPVVGAGERGPSGGGVAILSRGLAAGAGRPLQYGHPRVTGFIKRLPLEPVAVFHPEPRPPLLRGVGQHPDAHQRGPCTGSPNELQGRKCSESVDGVGSYHGPTIGLSRTRGRNPRRPTAHRGPPSHQTRRPDPGRCGRARRGLVGRRIPANRRAHARE